MLRDCTSTRPQPPSTTSDSLSLFDPGLAGQASRLPGRLDRWPVGAVARNVCLVVLCGDAEAYSWSLCRPRPPQNVSNPSSALEGAARWREEALQRSRGQSCIKFGSKRAFSAEAPCSLGRFSTQFRRPRPTGMSLPAGLLLDAAPQRSFSTALLGSSRPYAPSRQRSSYPLRPARPKHPDTAPQCQTSSRSGDATTRTRSPDRLQHTLLAVQALSNPRIRIAVDQFMSASPDRNERIRRPATRRSTHTSAPSHLRRVPLHRPGSQRTSPTAP